MKTVLAIVLYTLSLFGIELGHQVRIDHIQRDGSDVLYSKVVAQPTGTRFECLRSASGQCYYTVYARECTAPGHGADCAKSADRFALAKGDSRQLATLSTLRVCVSAEAGVAGADCE